MTDNMLLVESLNDMLLIGRCYRIYKKISQVSSVLMINYNSL